MIECSNPVNGLLISLRCSVLPSADNRQGSPIGILIVFAKASKFRSTKTLIGWVEHIARRESIENAFSENPEGKCHLGDL